MNFSKKAKQILSNLGILEEAEKLTREEFIASYSNSDNKSLALICAKYSQYNEDGSIGEVKRNLLINLYDNEQLTTNKRKYNINVYKTFCIILKLIEKCSRYNEIYSLPIEYIAKSAETSARTVKKSLNTLMKYNVIEFVGYSREYSHFAVCQFKSNNISLLKEWISHGQQLHEVEYDHNELNQALIDNTKSNIEKNQQKKIKKALIAMKECPMLIKKFDESNLLNKDEFYQKFLLDGSLRALSQFTLTKNPDKHKNMDKKYDLRSSLLEKLNNKYGTEYKEYDLPASIYTLSHYLKTGELLSRQDNYFYKLFATKVKQYYNIDTPYNDIDKEKVKLFCMLTYMHGYSYYNKAAILYGKKTLSVEERDAYIHNEYHMSINNFIQYFSGKSIDDVEDLFKYYKDFYQVTYNIMNDLCDIQRSKIFLYESLLCSILILKSHDLGYYVVNAYDGFYMPKNFISTFKTLLPEAYNEVKIIYEKYKNMSTREKNKELLDYLESINKIVTINNRKYVQIKNHLIDFYNYQFITIEQEQLIV